MYCTAEDVILMSGYSENDFKYRNDTMTVCQFVDMINSFITEATTLINRYCNVDTFELHSIEEEYHTLNGFDMYDYRLGFYTPQRMATQFFTENYQEASRTCVPREQPVVSIDKVEVNVSRNAEPNWETLKEFNVLYPDGSYGDGYIVTDVFEYTSILFKRAFSYQAKNNVRITYQAGYPDDNPVWDALRAATRIVVINMLNYKQRQQQITTLRSSGMMDYASLYQLPGDMDSYLTKDAKSILDKYVVTPLPTDMYD